MSNWWYRRMRTSKLQRFVNIINRLPDEMKFEIYKFVDNSYLPPGCSSSRFFTNMWNQLNVGRVNLRGQRLHDFQRIFFCGSEDREITLYINNVVEVEPLHCYLYGLSDSVTRYEIVYSNFTVSIGCVGHFDMLVMSNRQTSSESWWQSYRPAIFKSRDDREQSATLKANGDFLVTSNHGTRLVHSRFEAGYNINIWTLRRDPDGLSDPQLNYPTLCLQTTVWTLLALK